MLLLASSRTHTLIHYYSVSEPSGSCVTRCAYAPPFASHTQWAGGAWRAHAPQAARDARGQRLCACLSFPSVHHRSLNEKPKKKKKIYEEENKPPIHALTFRAFYFYIHIQIMRDDARSYYYVIYFLNYTYLVTLNKMMMMMMTRNNEKQEIIHTHDGRNDYNY